MKHYIKLLLFIFFTVPFSVYSSEQVIKIIGDDSYPPYSFNNKGKPGGIYTDIIQAASNKLLGFTVAIETKPWKRGLKMLESGEISFLYPPYKRPKSRPYMTYSVPILEEKLALFCRQDLMQTPRPNFPDDYKGLSIGENLGFSSGEKVKAAEKAGIIRLSSAKGTISNLKKLILKRLDCYINDRLSILVELKNLQNSNDYDGKSIVEATTISIEQGYLGIATQKTPPYTQKFIEEFNNTILSMQKDGSIDAIVDRHTK